MMFVMQEKLTNPVVAPPTLFPSAFDFLGCYRFRGRKTALAAVWMMAKK